MTLLSNISPTAPAAAPVHAQETLALAEALDAAIAHERAAHAAHDAAEAVAWRKGDEVDQATLDAQREAVAASDTIIAKIAVHPSRSIDTLRLKARAAAHARGSAIADAIGLSIIGMLCEENELEIRAA